ncbi:MAG: Amidohydrolase family protein [Burkholderiaceae bacterium]|jgi:hippurate hydrolase|nr:MAG: Amidohydrolase family protein [Burkholderiaceae bacterium]
MNTAYKPYCSVADLADSEALLTEIRHQLHRNPELSFQEAATAGLVAARLTEWGWQVAQGVGGHGVVGTLKVGDGPRRVALRADMDALPIHEASGAAHASRNAGVMHACGHDGHTAMLLGAARQLARTRNFNGTVILVFQPAEEAGQGSGAQRMIEDGFFERFPCDAIFALHNAPGMPVGHFMFRSGPFMAASDTVRITVRGRGGHAARPHQAVDPVLIAGSLIMALQSVVSRNIDPLETAIVTIATIQAGSATNVIPDSASLGLSVRSFSAEVRAQLEERIDALVTQHVHGYGGEADIDYRHGYPVLVNSAAETAFAHRIAEGLVGAQHATLPFPPVTGSEDFAYFLQQRPGCLLRLGNGEASAMLHNAAYDFDDRNLRIGAAYWTRLAEQYLAQGTAADRS